MTKSRLSLVLACCLGLAALVSAQRPDPADLALKAAMQQELVDGNLADAIDAYKQIVARYPTNAPVVAAALIRLGHAYETLGDAQARAAYEQVVRQFSNQTTAAAEARSRLLALGTPRPGNGTGAVRPVATGSDADSSAFITPDGRFLSRPDWDTGDLAIRDMSTGRVTRLAGGTRSSNPSAEEVDYAQLSPDGKQVLFVWCMDDGDKYQLRVMPNQAGARPRVLIDSPEFDYFEPVAWSPAGDAVLVHLYRPPGTRQTAWVALADGKITPVTPASRRFRRRAALSPDGKYLAYSALAVEPRPPLVVREGTPAPPTDQHLYLIATDGSGTETVLVKGTNINESPVWTPDGRHVVFVSNRTNAFGLWSVAVENGRPIGEPSPVRSGATGRIWPIGMTQSGTYYYVPEGSAVGGGAGMDVFVASLDAGTGVVRESGTRVSDNVVDWNRSPAWSPDGQRIAFARRLPVDANAGPEANTAGLVVRHVQTGEEVVHPFRFALNRRPLWFHHTEALLIERTNSRGKFLVHLDLKTGLWTPLESLVHVVGPDNWRAAALSRDDNTVFMTTYDSAASSGRGVATVVAWNLTTGTQRVVWRSEGRLASGLDVLALSPDGRTLATILQGEGWTGRRLVLIGVDGSSYRELTSPVQGDMLAWTPDSLAIFVVAGPPSESSLVRVAVETGRQVRTGLTIKRPTGHVVDISPDGSRIAYSDNTRDSELWAIENLAAMLARPR